MEEVDFWAKDGPETEEMRTAIIQAITNRPFGNTLKLLICFNPYAGTDSKKHLSNVLTFMEKTNLEPEVFETEYAGHCFEHLRTINPKEYCGVAIVSGDGLMHEFANSRVDLPVTHVPAGSGNGFAKTQTVNAGELCKDEEAIFLAVKNRVTGFHLIVIR